MSCCEKAWARWKQFSILRDWQTGPSLVHVHIVHGEMRLASPAHKMYSVHILYKKCTYSTCHAYFFSIASFCVLQFFLSRVCTYLSICFSFLCWLSFLFCGYLNIVQWMDNEHVYKYFPLYLCIFVSLYLCITVSYSCLFYKVTVTWSHWTDVYQAFFAFSYVYLFVFL